MVLLFGHIFHSPPDFTVGNSEDYNYTELRLASSQTIPKQAHSWIPPVSRKKKKITARHKYNISVPRPLQWITQSHHDLRQIPLGYMSILLLKVISLHILAAIQIAFPARGADLVAQGSLFCHWLFCYDLQGCLLHGNKKVTDFPLTSPRRREKRVLLFNGA